MPYFDYGDIFLIGVQVKTRDMLQKLQNRALRLVLNRDSRHNVWDLHHEALNPMLNESMVSFVSIRYMRVVNGSLVVCLSEYLPLRSHSVYISL